MRSGIFIALLLSVSAVLGQTVVMSNKPQLYERRTLYHKALGENEYGIFTLNYSSLDLGDGFNIEWYDPEFRFQRERHMEGPKGQQVIKVFLNGERLQWLAMDNRKRDSLSLVLYSLNSQLEGEIESTTLGRLPIRSLDLDQINVDYSAHRENLTFWALADAPEGSRLFMRQFHTGTAAELAKADTLLKLRDQDWYWYASDANNSGDALAVLRLYQGSKSVASSALDKEAYACFWNGTALSVVRVLPEQTVSDLDVVAHPLQRTFCIGALYAAKNVSESRGTARVLFDSSGLSQTTLHPWSDPVLSVLVGEKSRRKGALPEHFRIRQLLWLSDGGLGLVMEQFMESKQTETYYLNGIPQTSTKTLLTYGDVCLALVGQELGRDTAVLIRKNQVAAPSNSFLLGIGICQTEGQVHILYNDDIAHSNRVMDAVIGTDASVKRVSLLDSENTYSTVVPEDGRQTGYGSFILPIYRDKQWYWMQVLAYD